ncbi:hypothetical protein OHA21_36180 [Actinoplanes sp. NBC_00393]|uniref:hypothetical protein n=1 Tax=Actinoplanes sp. NBC_00393 TaxID=2975953 RepID=UPI002E2023E9
MALVDGVADGAGGVVTIWVGVGTGGSVSNGGAEDVVGAGSAVTVTVMVATGAAVGGAEEDGTVWGRAGRER